MTPPAEPVEKRPYTAPELTVYGTLAELTQGAPQGPRTDTEADPMGNPLRTG
ncbi:MAG: lasso RiPP family leader peptide-containing protein [Planctomycetes bacterium]|nr:lasso RiPP family leader peptide-containing protein [Planctomycetota bacterium]